MKPLGPLSLLVLAALAGCAATDDAGTGGTPGASSGPQHAALPFDPMPEGAGHDHADAAQHRFLWNYNVTSHDTLMANAANIAGLHAIDMQAGHLFGAVWGSHAASVDGGLVIWDVHTDPAHPREVGRWTIPGSVGGDRSVGATRDGAFAVIGLETRTCFGHVNPAGIVGAYLIDTRDKSSPVVADAMSNVRGVTAGGLAAGSTGSGATDVTGTHSVTVHAIGGKDYAFIYGQVYRIDRTETGGRLVFVSQVPTGHDIYLRDTPWNTTWGLSADGEAGLTVYNLTDPAKPQVIGVWKPTEEKQFRSVSEVAYYLHTADVAFVPAAGGALRTVIVQTSEDAGKHVSPMWVLDGDPLRAVQAGDKPVDLRQIGRWQNPGGHAAGPATFSLHNPRFHDGGLFTITSYHGGLWQLDLRDPASWGNPPPIAFAVWADPKTTLAADPVEAANAATTCGLSSNIETPSYVDVQVADRGTLYVADPFAGLYTLQPAPSHPVYGAQPAS